jgi:hypothetical protein
VIRWLYAFIDRPAATVASAHAFWTTVTGTTLSGLRGDHDEFATLLPADGDAWLKVQAVGGDGGVHLDLAVDDVRTTVEDAAGRGATVVADHGDYLVLRSPTGQLFCVVPWHGEADRPAPRVGPTGAVSRVDQVSIDVAETGVDDEVAFWAGLTGWTAHQGALPEFHVVKSPATMPLRLLVQRLDQPRPTGAHLDVACSDVAAVRAWHEECGASVVDKRPLWTVMRDPAGGIYCLTAREPATGSLPAWAQSLS